MSALLIVALLAPDAVLWRFPGPEGEDLRRAAVEAQAAGGLTGHLLTPDAVDAHLGAVDPAAMRDPAMLGCFADRAVCEDPRRAALPLLALSARVDATARRGDDGYLATLELTPADPTGAPRTYTGAGPTMAAALADAARSLDGQGGIEVAVTPADARLYLDDKPLGTGSGRYPVPPGAHRVRAEADGFVPLVQPIEVKSGEVTHLTFELGTSYSRLALKITPAEARVFLDGDPLINPAEPRDLPPGEYTLRVEADGHVPHEQTISLKPATQLTLTVGLPAERGDWWARFQEPHPDTLAHGFYLRADFRFVSVGDGPLDVSREVEGGKVDYDSLDESVGMLGLGVGAGWRSRYLMVDALTLTFEGGGGAAAVTRADGLDDRIEGMSRITVRPGWVGLRYPAWRFEPYLLGGVQFSFEDFEVLNETGGTEELSKAALLLGLELGVRMQITPEWSANVAAGLDFGVEARSAAALVMGVGYGFDIPGVF